LLARIAGRPRYLDSLACQDMLVVSLGTEASAPRLRYLHSLDCQDCWSSAKVPKPRYLVPGTQVALLVRIAGRQPRHLSPGT